MASLAGLAVGSGKRPENIPWFELDGGPHVAGLLGVDYTFNSRGENYVEEEICLRLKGTQEEMQAVLRQVLYALRGARHLGTPERAYLRLYSEGLKAYVYTPISDVEVESLPGHLTSRSSGSFAVRIRLTRDKNFVGDERPLTLYNSGGSSDALGLTLYNHDDGQAGHDNWFSVRSSLLSLTSPCPMRLVLSVPSGGKALGDIYIGSLLLSSPAVMPGMSLEAESGVGGTSHSDMTASNGRFQRYTWNGTGWAHLAQWDLPSMMVSDIGGQLLLPVLRLHTLLTQSDVRLRLVLKQQGKLIFEGPACTLKPGNHGQLFAPMVLSAPGLPALAYAAELKLSLEGMQKSLNTTLDVDDLMLLPLKSYSYYQSISGLALDSRLVDDTWRGMSWSVRNDEELKTHLSLGRGHYLFPGVEQRFFVFMGDTANKSPIDLSLKVQAWYRPVVEIL